MTDKRGVHRSKGLFEGRLRTSLEGVAAAVGIIDIEHRRLREHIGATAAGRMLLIALNLGGAAVLALHEQAKRYATYIEVGCEEAGLTVGLILGAVRVGEDVLHLFANAARESARESGGGAHDGQELTAGDAIEFEVLCALRELPHRPLIGVGTAGKTTPLGLTVFDASLGHR